MSTKCVGCNEERRCDRMSFHLLDKHREAILKESSNEKVLEECIRRNDSYINIAIRSSTNDRQHYWVSFGYSSGWKNEPSYKSAREKALEHRCQHLVVCNELLKELRHLKEKEKKGSITQEDMLRNGELAKKYSDECEKHFKTKTSLATARRMADKYMDMHDVIKRVFKINNDTFDALEMLVDDIYRTYKDDDRRTKEVRNDLLETISMKDVMDKMEQMKKEAKEEEADEW